MRLSWLRRAHLAQEPALNRGQQLMPREECKTGNAVNDRSPDLPTEKWEDQKKAGTSPCTPPKPARCPADCHLNTSATNTSPVMPPHDPDSSAISQALSHHTTGQKSQSNDNRLI